MAQSRKTKFDKFSQTDNQKLDNSTVHFI